ncbi:MAG: penicillin-insensitive murein endopeptidase [Pseudolabrys sp.]
MVSGRRARIRKANFASYDAAPYMPSLGRAMAIGYYPQVVFKGGSNCPTTGPTWQVMQVSRSRNWGHPELVQFLKRFAPLAAEATGWKGILIGDMAQPRGVRNITAMSSR